MWFAAALGHATLSVASEVALGVDPIKSKCLLSRDLADSSKFNCGMSMPRSETDLCASLAAWLVALLGISLAGGCASQFQKPSNLPLTNRPIASPDSLQLVRDLARPWGTKWIEVEGVTLAVGLNRTGSDPPPNTERGMLLKEMQVREVENPDSVLASPDTALVMVRALIPPGAQKGDRLDLEVRVPVRSETTSLQGGWAMLSRLREFVKLNRRLSQGNVLSTRAR